MNDWLEVYKLQYERIAQHENQRLTFSSLVIAISTATLAFASSNLSSSLNLIQFSLLLSLLIAINIFAIQFVSKSRYWVKFHQERAKKLLAGATEDIKVAIEGVEKKNSDKDVFRRPNLQKNLHLCTIVVIVLFALSYSWSFIKPLVCCVSNGVGP